MFKIGHVAKPNAITATRHQTDRDYMAGETIFIRQQMLYCSSHLVDVLPLFSLTIDSRTNIDIYLVLPFTVVARIYT